MKRTKTILRQLSGLCGGLLIGMTCAQLAIGGPRSVFNHPSPPAKGADQSATQIKQGDLSVATQTGALTFSYPITVPPGRLGNQPSLALSYSSQAPIYGGIAAGWSLNIPEIKVDASRGRSFDYNEPANPQPRQYVSSLAGGHRLLRTNILYGEYRAQYDSTFTEYQIGLGAGDLPWRARTPDGMTYEFGHHDHLGGVEPTTRWPLTKTIDKFGNEVSYYYGGHLTLQRIEYTTNTAAGITAPHALVEFFYETDFCPGGSNEIGALLDRTTGVLDRIGESKLTHVITRARLSDSSSIRPVRRIDLVYDADVANCFADHGPQRHLTQIHETAWNEEGVETELPPTTFEYGPAGALPWSAATTYDMSPPTPDAPAEAIVWGERYESRFAWPTVRSMLLDFDGDGRTDRLYSPPADVIAATGQCSFQWERGTDTGFVPTGETVNLPTIPWQQPDEPDIDWVGEPGEGCSLAGQRTAMTTRESAICTYPIGSYLSYRFLDMDSDGLPDLVAALHYDKLYASSDDADIYDRMGLPAPSCTPSPGACPKIETDCRNDATICGPSGACSVDKSELITCIEDSPRIECESIMKKDVSEEEGKDEGDGFVFTDTGICIIEDAEIVFCFPDPDPEPEYPDYYDDGGGPPAENPCSAQNRGRDALSACGHYVWYWYRNEGGSLATSPEVVLSPVPLEVESGLGGVGLGPNMVTSGDHGILDLNGDGHLDAFAKDARPELEVIPHVEEWWYVWFGDGDGNFTGPYGDSTPFVWDTPWGAPPQDSSLGISTYTDDESRGVRSMIEIAGLYDVNGDGLPDLVWRNPNPADYRLRVFFNYGLGFKPDDETSKSFEWLAERLFWSTISQAQMLALELPLFYVEEASRRQVSAPMDRDGDGRVDWFSPMHYATTGPELWVPTWLPNDGGRLHEGAAMTGDEWATVPDWVQLDPGRWWVNQRLVDLSGDGRPDVAYFAGGEGKVRRELFGGKPARLLHRVDNGRGLVTDIRYAPHTEDDVVTQDPDSGRAMPSPLWVVESIESVDAFGSTTATTSYHYHHPVRNRDWLGSYGFRGFEQVQYVAPRGSINIEKYDYAVDWSGRHSVSRTRWVEFELFSSAETPLNTFHETASSTWLCSTGQTKADCMASGAQHTTITTWSPQVAETALLLAPTTELELTGTLAYISGAPDLSSYVYQLADRQTTTKYALEHDADSYLLRQTETELIGMGTVPIQSFGKTKLIYDETGRVVEEIHVEVEDDEWAVTKQTFDVDTGLRLSVQKPKQSAIAGDRTDFVYDAAKVFVATTTNEAGHVVETDYDYGTGALLSTRGPNSAGGELEETRAIIDGLGRVVRAEGTIDDGAGGYSLVPVSWTTYFDPIVGVPSPAPARVRTENLIDYGASDKTWEEVTLNGRGAPTQRSVDTGSGIAIESYAYDEDGNLVRMTTPSPKGGSGVVTYDYTFDPLGRQTGFRGPGAGAARNGSDTIYGPEPGKVTVTDHVPAAASDPTEPVATTVTWHDVLGRLVEVDEQLDDGSWAITTYEYDAQNRLTHVMDPDGIITDLAYDYVNRRAITRGARTWEYDYDLNGNMTAQRMPRPGGAPSSLYGVSTLYDELDRPTSQFAGTRDLTDDEKTQTLADLVTHWYYDSGAHGIGRLDRVSFDYWKTFCFWGSCSGFWVPAWYAQYDYDARGNVVEEDRYFNLARAGYSFNDSRSMSSEYNALGAVTSTTYADGSTVDFTYDRRGLHDHVTWMSPAGPRQLADMTYHLAGNRSRQTSPDYRRDWLYDDWGRVTLDYGRAGGTYSHYEQYNWFGAGDLKTQRTYRKSGVDNVFYYRYDDRHQLTEVTDLQLGYDASFGYTPGGRLDTATVAAPGAVIAYPRDVSYDYSGASDPQAVDALMRNDGTGIYAAYQYNEAGGMTQRTVYGCTWCISAKTTYRYDGYDRLRIATAPYSITSEAHYYGPGAQRWLALTRDNSGAPTGLRFWFGDTEITYSASGSPTKTVARVNAGTPLARIENASNLEYLATSGLGHLMGAVSASGAVEAQFIYSPFGEILRQNGVDTAGHMRRFNGKDYDTTSGLYYYGHRFYDPRALVWTRSDPLYRFAPDAAYDEPRRMNLYTFTLNNPLSLVDPDGLTVPKHTKYDPTQFLKDLWTGFGCILGCNDAGGGQVKRDESGSAVKDKDGNIAQRSVGAPRKSTWQEVKDYATLGAGVGLGKLFARFLTPGAPKSARRHADDVADDAVDGATRQGGAHGDLRPNVFEERHHTPANSTSPLSTAKGPAFKMKTPDHRKTASWGNSRKARSYRARQARLIKAGKVKQAVQMDIDDVRRLFGDRYDLGIRQMQQYLGTVEDLFSK